MDFSDFLIRSLLPDGLKEKIAEVATNRCVTVMFEAMEFVGAAAMSVESIVFHPQTNKKYLLVFKEVSDDEANDLKAKMEEREKAKKAESKSNLCDCPGCVEARKGREQQQ